MAAAPGGQVVDTTLTSRAATQVVKKVDSWVLTAAQMLPNILVAIIVLVLFWLAAMLTGRLVKRMVLRFSPYSHIAKLIADISRLAVIAIGVILALSAMSLDRAVASMLAGVGIVSLAIGFASKDIASDYLAGLMIHFTHPYRAGDLLRRGIFSGTSIYWSCASPYAGPSKARESSFLTARSSVTNLSISPPWGCAGWI